MKHALLFTLFIFALQQLATQVAPPTHVKIHLTSVADVPRLLANGVAADHYHTDAGGGAEIILNTEELAVVNTLRLPYRVLITDLEDYYRDILNASGARSTESDCGLVHFDAGEMGGYHTYQEVQDHINMMQEAYPELARVIEIGNSVEDRIIYAVKISDNVNDDESTTEGVAYYDALTHAREPMSMETNLYYMWWLLENYGTDAEATYLVDHREMYFVPVVNPDGYVFNQTNYPDGGGLWRKNRSNNGNACPGTDLNRNYGFGWGDPQGSSDDPCSELYRGSAAFSEPETQAIRDFTGSIQPATAFSCHAYSDVFLCPNAFNNEVDRFDLYAEFASEFSPRNYAGYGNWVDMIYYYGAGTTHDYLNSAGAVAYTPEIGHEFWEPASVICDRITEMLPAMKYLSWVAGDFTVYHDFTVLGSGSVLENEPLLLDVRVKNRGLAQPANNVSVSLSTTHPSLAGITTALTYGTLAPRSFAGNTSGTFEFAVIGPVAPGEAIPIYVTVSQDGAVVYEDEFFLYGGARNVLFADDAENGSGNWTQGPGNWATTTFDAVSGDHSFADSPERGYLDQVDTRFQLASTLDLSNAEEPWVTYHAKWSFDANADYVEVMASSDLGATWAPLTGIHTQATTGLPTYRATKHWVQERISLEEYIGQADVLLSFHLVSSQGRQSDGFYFDDFEVVDYVSTDTMISATSLVKTAATELDIFPNPATDLLTLVNNIAFGESVSIRLLDGRARPVLEAVLDMSQIHTRHTLDLGPLPAGIYYLEMAGGTRSGYRKVIKLNK